MHTAHTVKPGSKTEANILVDTSKKFLKIKGRVYKIFSSTQEVTAYLALLLIHGTQN
jgi:hypothetical protein